LIFVCLFVCLLACLSVFVACARWIEFFQVGRPKEFGILFVLLLL
jgi:hypothetical protein